VTRADDLSRRIRAALEEAESVLATDKTYSRSMWNIARDYLKTFAEALAEEPEAETAPVHDFEMGDWVVIEDPSSVIGPVRVIPASEWIAQHGPPPPPDRLYVRDRQGRCWATVSSRAHATPPRPDEAALRAQGWELTEDCRVPDPHNDVYVGCDGDILGPWRALPAAESEYKGYRWIVRHIHNGAQIGPLKTSEPARGYQTPCLRCEMHSANEVTSCPIKSLIGAVSLATGATIGLFECPAFISRETPTPTEP